MRILALLAILVLPLATNAQNLLWGATGGAAVSDLYTISTTTGAATPVGPIGHGVTGLARHPVTGVMYGVTSNTPACARCLITVNLATGAGTVVGPLGQTIAELAFRADGTLFGWSESGDNLATINLVTGVATTVGPSGIGTFGDGLVFSGGQLFVMADGDDGDYHTVNTATGVATLAGVLTGSPGGGLGLAVSAAATQPGTGTIFASVQNFGAAPAFLVRVNLTTGVITNVGPTVVGIDALEFAPAPAPAGPTMIPTLSEWALILLALTTLLLGARRLRARGGIPT